MGSVQSSSNPRRKNDGSRGEDSGRSKRTRLSEAPPEDHDDASGCSNASSSPIEQLLCGLSAFDTEQATRFPDNDDVARDTYGNHGSPLLGLLNGLSLVEDTSEANYCGSRRADECGCSNDSSSPIEQLLRGLSAFDTEQATRFPDKEISGQPTSHRRTLFRLLREDEVGHAQTREDALIFVGAHGIHPKDETATYSVKDHIVSGLLKTRWTSLTTSYDKALYLASSAIHRLGVEGPLFIVEVSIDTSRGEILDFSGETEQSLKDRQEHLGSSAYALNASRYFQEVAVGRVVSTDEIVSLGLVPQNLEDLSITASRARVTTFDEQIERTLELLSEARAGVSGDEEADRFSLDSILPLDRQMALHDRITAKIEARGGDSSGFELHSSLKRTAEIRPNSQQGSGANAVFVGMGYYNPHQGCPPRHKGGRFRFADGDKSVLLFFHTKALEQQLLPCIEQFMAEMKTKKKIGHRKATALTHEEFMTALVERIRTSPAFISHVDNNPLSPMDWWMKTLSNLHSACGTTITMTSNHIVKEIPCLCSDPDCGEDVVLTRGATYGHIKRANGQAHLRSEVCAEVQLNLRRTESGHLVFDAPLFGLYGVMVSDKTIAPLIFKQGSTGDNWAVLGRFLSPQARALDVLNGTGLGDSLVGSTNELRRAIREYQHEYRSREGVRDHKNEQARNRDRARAEGRRELLQQQLAELDGDNSLSEEKKRERIELVLELSGDLYVEYGSAPLLLRCKIGSGCSESAEGQSQWRTDSRDPQT